MNSRSLITLAVAVVIGLGAMKLSQHMMSSDKGKKDETQDVLVAARDFKEEETLKADMVKVITMVRSAVPPNAFSSFKDVEERWVRTAMLEGDVLVEKKLGPKGTPPGLVANIPKGMRAFAIDVTEQSGVSGFILPGHRVDVIRFDTSQKNEIHGETILQNVLVLASGQVFTRPEERDGSVADGDTGTLSPRRRRSGCSACQGGSVAGTARGQRPRPGGTAEAQAHGRPGAREATQAHG